MGVVTGDDKHAHEPFAVTVALAVLTVRAGTLHVLLVERGQEPYAGQWALPGGFLLPRESAETAARRELAEETGPADVFGLHLEQQCAYSEPGRDPRMRVVSVAFTALLPDPPEPRGGGDAARTRRLPWGTAGPLAFDHDRILADARERIGALPGDQCVSPPPPARPSSPSMNCSRSTRRCGGRALDRPNVRRKVLATPGFVEPVPGAARLSGGRGKPAALNRPGPATNLHPPLHRPSRKGHPA
ncbi:NUDIX hydrolase [Streptomyces sp. MUM 16J]|nr:NUDIX hydrolase [Streptomyces sp. MUM 16J]